MLAAASKIQASNSFCVSTIFFFVNFAVHLPQKQKSNASEKRVRRTVHTRCRQLYLDNHSELDTLSYNFFSQWPLLSPCKILTFPPESYTYIWWYMFIYVYLCTICLFWKGYESEIWNSSHFWGFIFFKTTSTSYMTMSLSADSVCSIHLLVFEGKFWKWRKSLTDFCFSYKVLFLWLMPLSE